MAFDQETLAKVRARRKAPPKGTPTSGNKKPAARTPTKPPKKAAPVDPAQAALDTETAAAVRTKFGPSERAIAGEQNVSTAQQGNITDWFNGPNGYQATVQASNQRRNDYDAGIRKAQSDQAIQAQTMDNAAAATPEATQAAAARRSTSDSFGAQLAAQASAQNAYGEDKVRIGAGEAADQHLKESARSRSLAQELKDLLGQKGDFEIGYRADAKAAAHKTALEDAAFDLDTATAQSDADLKKAAQDSLDADRKADNKSAASKETTRKMESDRQYGLDKDKVGAAAAKDAYQKKHKLGPYKPAAGKGGPSEADKRLEKTRVAGVRKDSRTALNRLDEAKGAWDALNGKKLTTGRAQTDGPDKGDPVMDGKGFPESKPMTAADKKAELAKQGYTPNEIHLMLTKLWGKQEIAMAHQLGIKVPRDRIRQSAVNPGSGKNQPSRTGAGDMTTGK